MGSTSEAFHGDRYALLIGVDQYSTGLGQLKAPSFDVNALAEVLGDAEIGGFEVTKLLNENYSTTLRELETFFSRRKATDLVFAYFAGHGLKNQDGDLYLATHDSEVTLLNSTAISAQFINQRMYECTAKRIVLLLDCCYGGAFARGMRPRSVGADQIDLDGVFRASAGPDWESRGRGLVVITASGATQFAYEGDELVPGELTTRASASVFNAALVHGLSTGEADMDRDGQIELDELYKYIYKRVASKSQTPQFWAYGLQGPFPIARVPRRLPVGPAPDADEARGPVNPPADPEVPEHEWTELVRLFSRWPATVVFSLYAQVVGDSGRPLDCDCRDVPHTFRLLAQQLYRPNGMPPLLELAEWQACLTQEPDARLALRSWVARVARGLAISTDSLTALRVDVGRRAAQELPGSHLVIKLERDAIRDDAYGLSVLLYLHGRADPDPQTCDETPVQTLGEIREQLYRRMSDWARTADRYKLTVEFLVPRELLSHEFDLWIVNLGNHSEYPLGTVYTVVVRDLDRLRNESIHAEWRRRWSKLQSASGRFRRIDAPGFHAQRFYGELADSRDCVCIALTSPPGQVGEAHSRAWAVAADAGLPAAVWPRAHGEPAVVGAELELVLGNGPLATLPERISKIRRSAAGHDGDGQLGGHLTLVWDDPTRVPRPGPALAAPATLRGPSQ